MSKQHTAMMEERLGALKAFYAVLTPEQQKVFDTNAMRGGHRGHHGKRMMHG
jgi:periplasmic protein CpxP/Spy